MNTSLLIAQVLGPIYLAVAIGVLTNKKHYEKVFKEYLKHEVCLYMGGILALIVGLLIVQAHNVWVKDWTLLVTLIGWIATIKGVWLLAFPEMAKKQSELWIKGKLTVTGGSVALLLGLVFTYFGYFH